MQGNPLGFRQRLSVLADVVKHELLINVGHLRLVLHNNILSEPDFFPSCFSFILNVIIGGVVVQDFWIIFSYVERILMGLQINLNFK